MGDIENPRNIAENHSPENQHNLYTIIVQPPLEERTNIIYNT